MSVKPGFRAKGWDSFTPAKDRKCDGCGLTPELGLDLAWRRGSFSKILCGDCKFLYIFSGKVAGKEVDA